MFFCLNMNDTNQFEPNLIDILDNLFNVNDSLSYSFWLSVVLLILITLFKYFFSKETLKDDWGNILLELPIDLCTIATTVVITGFITEETLPHGIIISFITLIVCAICCYFRRLAINHSYSESIDYMMLVFAFFDIFVAGAWISWVYLSIL